MAETMAALLRGDAAAFETLLQSLMSAQNEQRSAAEAMFTELKKVPDVCVGSLVRSLRHSSDTMHRSLSAVLLRKTLTRDDESIWGKLSNDAKELVKTECLNCIKEEPQAAITKKVCDLVSQLAVGLVEEGGWPALLPFMFQCVRSGQERYVESSLLVFAQLAKHVMNVLLQYLDTLHEILKACLAHECMDVRLAAMKATCSFVEELESASERDRFQDLVPLLIQTIGRALNSGEDPAAQDALALLIEIAEAHPRFFRRQLADVVEAMLQIANSEDVDAGPRSLAAELLVTLCESREKAPGMMRKLPSIAERLLGTLLRFLLDVEDAPEWHAAEEDKDEDAGEGELYEFGQECLDRVSLALGGKTLLPSVARALPALQADASSWQSRAAALIALAQIAEGCAKVMAREAGPLCDLCVRGAQDAHARVRWASCQALGQLCTDLGPDLQDEHHARILPTLMGLMEDVGNPRVQAHACNALVNFCDGCDPDTLGPYLDALVPKLLTLLKTSRKAVQEASLTALASLADCAQSSFARYYGEAMPLLRHALEHAGGAPQTALLRAKALECASLVGMAVGREVFREDAHAIMRAMQAAVAAGLAPDDPLGGYVAQAGARICKTLCEEFLPYLPVVMPGLLASASVAPDVSVCAAASDSEGEDEDEDGDVETYVVGDRRVSLRTSLLEEKATACSMLCCYANELGAGFAGYVAPVRDVMIPLLKFFFHEEVRSAAAQCLPELLRCARRAAEQGAPGAAELFRETLAASWEPLCDAAAHEPDQEVLYHELEAAAEVVELASGEALAGALPVEALRPLFASVEAVLRAYEERREERLARAAGEDFDADEAEALEEEHERESELLDAVGSVLGACLRARGDGALPAVEGLMPAVGALLGKGRFAEERRVALCIMDDVVEHSPAGAAKYLPQVAPLLLQGARDADPGVRQCALYGLGTAAVAQPAGFAPHVPAALEATLAALRAPDARGGDGAAAADNAASALLKLMERFPEAASDPALGRALVDALPLRDDRAEARVVHAGVLQAVQRQDARVLGAGNEHLPKLARAFCYVLGRGEVLLEARDRPAMAAVLLQIKGALPEEVFGACVRQLKPGQQAALQRALQGGEAGAQ